MNELLNIIFADTFLTFLAIAIVMILGAGILAFISDKVAGTKFGQKVAEKFLGTVEEEEEEEEEGFTIDE